MTPNQTSIVATVTFNTPFRVGTGTAGDGLDERIDHNDPLPASSIKGLMRQEARNLLGASDSPGPNDDPELVQQVFGAPWFPCPWHWCVTVDRLTPSVRVNVQLDDGGMVVPGALLVKEEATITSANLVITQIAPLSQGVHRLSQTANLQQHLALLRVSAALVEKIGQKRTRGMGWAQINVVSPDWAADLTTLKPVRTRQSTGEPA